MNELKYKGYSIVFQEVPNEITLAINICGCPYQCKGCHSKYLWDDNGTELNEKELSSLIDKYKNYITCVCFMGGDWEFDILKKLKNKVKSYGLKTAIYSGSDSERTLRILKRFDFDYIKIGSYNEELGGLNSKITNQKMYKKENDKYVDITKSFIKERN
jgi:anaerobic ribonucleoside-triphosphate reductase activating protein